MNAPCAVSIVRAILLIGLALCAAQHCAAAEEQHEGQEQLGSIAFEDDNGRVRFPISLRGREFSFVLSTGDNYSCIDSSYRPLLGPRIGEVEQIGGFASKAQVAVHHCPPGMLAGYPLGLDSIASRDLTRLSSEFDRAVDGELGFDILRHWVVEIDWDRHRLRLSQA
ncbi:MAG TPA: hypothetical protein VMF30_18845, partial [Pirellulales bacterium]|nr:hypothetical protein [Pirellulales bacterium]